MASSIPSIQNGVLFICIDGTIFPKEVVAATLVREIPILEESLREISVNKELFDMARDKAFTELYRIRFPSWDDYESGIVRWLVTNKHNAVQALDSVSVLQLVIG